MTPATEIPQDLANLASQTSSPPPIFTAPAEESPGFAYLAARGPRAVRAFKLLEVARSIVARRGETAELNLAEWSLLQLMLGRDQLEWAVHAYLDCKARTRHLHSLTAIDARMAWRLTELIHLYENVMAYGRRTGRLDDSQAGRVLEILIRDFGEYYGVLCDDLSTSKRDQIASLASYLWAFRASPLFSSALPVEAMTRLPIADPACSRLLDFEIARSIRPHELAVKERIVRGDWNGALATRDSVEFSLHRMTISYAWDLDASGIDALDAILPVVAVSAFSGFGSLREAEEYVERRRREIRLAEQQCFAVLRCLAHFQGQVPPRMKEFRASDVAVAAYQVYREREKQRGPQLASTAGGMIKEVVSGAFQKFSRPVEFDWPANRTLFRVAGYADTLLFFPQHVQVKGDNGLEDYVFLCHAHADQDPRAETPLMFEYQAVIEDGLLFDAHAAARDGFAATPDAFRRTLEAGPAVLHARHVLHPGEAVATVDPEEIKLLGTFVSLRGGMRSWMGQEYVFSDRGADLFTAYADVRAFLSRLG